MLCGVCVVCVGCIVYLVADVAAQSNCVVLASVAAGGWVDLANVNLQAQERQSGTR